MNKISKYLITVVIMISTTAVVIAEDYKIGVVNPLYILELSPQGKSMSALLQKEFEPKLRELEVLQKKMLADNERRKKDAAIMSETELRKLDRDIVLQQRDIKRKEEQYNDDLNFRKNEEISKVQKDIIEAIQAVAQQNSYDIVLGQGVYHASAKVNMTQQVLDYLSTKAGD